MLCYNENSRNFQELRSKGGDGGEQEEGEEKGKTRGRQERAEEPS